MLLCFILCCVNFQSSVSFAQALSTMPSYSFEQSIFNEESNNLNWEPVDNIVSELWPPFYRHACVTKNLLGTGNAITQPQLALAGNRQKVAYFEILNVSLRPVQGS